MLSALDYYYENQIYNVLRIVKNKADTELGEYEYGEVYSFTGSFYEHYRSFHNDLMTEVDSVIELISSPQAKDDLVSVEEVEEEIPEIEKLQFRTKVILLQELGVLDLLKQKEPLKNGTNLAKLIAELVCGVDGDTNRAYKAVKKDLTYVSHRNNEHSPYTAKQIKIVNQILTSLSLPIIK